MNIRYWEWHYKSGRGGWVDLESVVRVEDDTQTGRVEIYTKYAGFSMVLAFEDRTRFLVQWEKFVATRECEFRTVFLPQPAVDGA